jgi:hypothetical protein
VEPLALRALESCDLGRLPYPIALTAGRLVSAQLLRRLPLPLAQLYRLAHNAKTPRDRLDTAYLLWEATL